MIITRATARILPSLTLELRRSLMVLLSETTGLNTISTPLLAIGCKANGLVAVVLFLKLLSVIGCDAIGYTASRIY